MKVLHVLNDSIPLIGGYTSRSRYIVSHQKSIGMEPSVVTSVRQGTTTMNVERIDGIQYFRTDRSRKTTFFRRIPIIAILSEIVLLYKRIRYVIRAVHPDVIHAHSPVLCAIPAILTAKIHRIPIVYEIRAFWEDAAVASKKFSEMSSIYWAIRTIETYVCKRVDRVVTICQAMKSDLVLRGISQDKIFVVPNGVDPIVFENKDKNPNLVSRLGLEEKFVFGYIGTFYDFEGVDDLVDAFHKLHEQEENVALLLVGGGETEGAIKERLKKFNADHIIFVGKVPHEKVFDYYTLVDVMIYPRKSTRVTEMTTPLKPLEAMALGKPIICSSVGGMVELVGIDNGLYFKPGNVNELIECCMRLIRNPLLRKQIGEKGRNRALRERTWKDIINKYADIYKI